MLKLSYSEIEYLLTNKESLTVLIDYHNMQAVYADAIGEGYDNCVEYHNKKAKEYYDLRLAIEDE